MNIWFRSSRHQIVYRKDELNAAGIYGGRITKLGFDVVQKPLYNLPNYTIKMRHDTLSSASSHNPGPFQTVYFNSLYIPDTTGFDMLTLDSTFIWNGYDNIVIDICWDRVSPTFNSSGTVRYYQDTIIDIARYAWSDGVDMCANNTSGTAIKPQIRFEFVPLLPNDAALIGTNLTTSMCSGSTLVKAKVANYGTNIINSINVGWSVNGVAQTPVSFSTPIDTLNSSGPNFQEVNLGNYIFVTGGVYVFKVYSYLPNSSTDPYPLNDTINFTVYGGMSGTYTIGGTSPDFATITSALNAVSTSGICDTVVLSIRSGTYNEQLTIQSISSASNSDYVIIQSESGDSTAVVISFSATSANNFTVNFNNARRIVFRDLTLKALNTTYGRVVNLTGLNLSNLAFFKMRSHWR